MIDLLKMTHSNSAYKKSCRKWLVVKHTVSRLSEDFMVSLLIPEVCKSLPDDPLLDRGICAKVKIQQLSVVSNHFGVFLQFEVGIHPACQGKDLFQYFSSGA